MIEKKSLRSTASELAIFKTPSGIAASMSGRLRDGTQQPGATKASKVPKALRQRQGLVGITAVFGYGWQSITLDHYILRLRWAIQTKLPNINASLWPDSCRSGPLAFGKKMPTHPMSESLEGER